MPVRWPAALVSVGILVVLACGGARADFMAWSNYQGKGEIIISVEDVNMDIQMEQTYKKPGTMIISLDLFGLKQTVFTEGNIEKTYNPAQGLLIEKRFANLDKAETNPMIAAQASMEDLGRRVREAKSATNVGKETVIGFECDVIDLETRELLQGLSSDGVFGGGKVAKSLGPKMKAWISREWGIPLRIEIPAPEGKPAMTFKFTELKVNSERIADRLGLSVPKGTRHVVLNVDLADREWESKMQAELRKAIEPGPKESGSGK
jgi:outer membrane lipoprotein-sorting protein